MKKNFRPFVIVIIGLLFVVGISLLVASFIVLSANESHQLEIQESQKKMGVLQLQYEALQEDLNQLEILYNGLVKEKATSANEHEKMIEQYKVAIANYESEILELLDKNSSLTDEINSLQQEMKQLQADLQAKKELQKDNLQTSATLPSNSNSSQGTISTNVHGNKKVFLTFDDGPTSLTPHVLDTLAEYQIPASFFVIGQRMESNQKIVQRAYREGHTILPHSHTHDYAIYTTLETFYDDLNKVEAVYKSVLGEEAPKIFRFPGGSSNHSSFQYGGKQFMPKLTEDIKAKGYTYVDWNVSSGDAGPNVGNPSNMKSDIINQSSGKDFIILLFHDSAGNDGMLKILPDVITYYKEQGYSFRSFRDVTKEELKVMEKKLLANKPIIR